MNTALVSIRELSYAYAKGNDPVLKNLSFDVPEHKKIALLGPNGSGKSTLFKILCTQLHGWTGEVHFSGLDLTHNESQVRAQLGVCFQSPSLDRILTGRENLALHAKVLGVPTAKATYEIANLGTKLRVNYLDKRVAEMSGGQARRIEIMKAFLGLPRLLLLDEPTNGLDPQARRDFWHELGSLASEKNATVLVTTHLIEEAELCDELILMSEGQCVAQGSPLTLRTELGYELFQIVAPDLPALLQQLEPILRAGEKAEIQHDSLRIKTPRAQELFEKLRELKRTDIQRMEWAKPTLADAYFEKTGKALQ